MGQRWADACVAELRAAERRLCGGWPGTMREARGRLRQAIGGHEVADDRVAALASLTYKSARDAWQQVVEREPDPEGDDDDEG